MKPTFPSTLRKEERIYSKKLIDALFQGGHSRSMSAFPLRVVYMPIGKPDCREEQGVNRGAQDGNRKEREVNTEAQKVNREEQMVNMPLSRFLISVPKRYLRHAVERNRVKRQVREAYRRHKSLVADQAVALAFIWLDSRMYTSKDVEAHVVNLLKRVREKLHQTRKSPRRRQQHDNSRNSNNG